MTQGKTNLFCQIYAADDTWLCFVEHSFIFSNNGYIFGSQALHDYWGHPDISRMKKKCNQVRMTLKEQTNQFT